MFSRYNSLPSMKHPITSIILWFVLLFAVPLASASIDAPPLSDFVNHGEAIIDDRLLQDIHSPVAETLSFIIQAGDVLIFNLPDRINGQEVESYRIKSSPSLSWLVDYSFFWRTLTKDSGEHTILLSALKGGILVEDLVIQVDVR